MMTTIVAKVDALAKKVDRMAVSTLPQYFPVDSSIDFMVQEVIKQVDYVSNPT